MPSELFAIFTASDEFGRNLLASTAASVAMSYLEAGASALFAIVLPLLFAGVATARRSSWMRWTAYAVTRVLDTIPLFLWLAIVFFAIDSHGFWGRQLAIILVAFPFTLGIVLNRFDVIARQSFVQNARAAGVRLPERLIRLVIPNGISSVYYPAVIIFGLGLTFDAVLGIMGMANRSTLSLGTLLWRAKERASVDPLLGVLTLGAVIVTIVVFAMLRQAQDSRNGPQALTHPFKDEDPDSVASDSFERKEPANSHRRRAINFEIRDYIGECVGLFGPSGVGKTTVIEAICEKGLSERGSRKIQYLPQNPRDIFPPDVCIAFVSDAIANEQVEPTAYRLRCRALLEGLEIDADTAFRSHASSLSGGEIQRVALALLLATDPDVLLADEPTSSLDGHAKALVINLLKSAHKDHSLSIVVASHDVEFIQRICSRVLTIRDGELAEAVPDVAVEFPRLRLDGPATAPLLDVSINRHLTPASLHTKRRTLISDFHESFHSGRIYGLAGPSGVGKSTLLRIIAGHEQPTSGSVDRLAHIGSRPYTLLTPQDPRLFFNVRQSMGSFSRFLAARTGGHPSPIDLERILEELGLPGATILERGVNQVSGGEIQRIALAVTLWLMPQLTCLDEIETGVPALQRNKIAELIRRSIYGTGRTAVIVSHDRNFLLSACDRIIDLRV